MRPIARKVAFLLSLIAFLSLFAGGQAKPKTPAAGARKAQTPAAPAAPTTSASAPTADHDAALDRALKTLRGAEEKELPREERVASWNGKKVTILGATPLRCPDHAGELHAYSVVGDARPKYSRPKLQEAGFVGQTATITVLSKEEGEWRVVLQLDRGEKLSTGEYGAGQLGFHTELEAAKGWIGRSFWTKGGISLLPDADVCTPAAKFDSERRIQLPHLSRIDVVAAEFGRAGDSIYLQVKTADGRTGWLDGRHGTNYIDPHFHLHGTPFEKSLFTSDPRKQYANWSPAIWKLIEARQVAIGMTEEQALLACGGEMKAIGFTIGAGSSDVSMIYRCQRAENRDFVIEKGKVKEYAEARRY